MRLGLGLGIDNNRILNTGAAFAFLLDDYSGAAAAYSIRLLSSTYSGALAEIRRSSDNAVKSFYPDSNNQLSLNSEDGASTSLSSWIGSDNGFIRTWYDQSGNSNNLTQTTTSNQPQIITSGAFITDNGKPSLEFTGGQNLISGSNTGIANNDSRTFINVINRDNSSDAEAYTSIGVSSLLDLWDLTPEYAVRISGGFALFGGGTVGSQEIAINILTGTDLSSCTLYVNNSSVSRTSINNQTPTTTDSPIVIGSRVNSTAYFNGKQQEVILYEADKTTDLNGINSNINNFYSIY